MTEEQKAPRAPRKKPLKQKAAAVQGVFTCDQQALLTLLQEHALGLREMSSGQVTVALALLKLYMPAAVLEDDNRGRTAAHEEALRDLE